MKEGFPKLRLNASETPNDKQEVIAPKPDLDLLRAKDEFVFQYGELTEGHPTLEYVKNLAKKIHSKEGIPLIIKIVPDWKEANAAAFSDGTIFISTTLIKEAETEEALLGVIAHEYVHVYKEHIKKQNEKEVKSMPALLERLSLMRGHEYEADLRGVLVDMEKAGINPLGYKAFLEKKLMKKDSDFTHGSGTDRVLNMAAAIHLIDFKSLSQDLHEIFPEAIKNLDSDQNIISNFDLIRSRFLRSGNLPEAKILERKMARDRVIDRITTFKEAMTAIKIIAWTASAQPKYGEKNQDLDVDESIGQIYAKLDSLLPVELKENEKENLKIFAMEMFADLNVFEGIKKKPQQWVPKFFLRLDKAKEESFNTPEKILKVLDSVLKHASSFDIEYSKSMSYVAGDIIKFALKNNFFGELTKETIETETVKLFVAECASSLCKLGEKFGQKTTVEDLSKNMKDRMLISVSNMEQSSPKEDKFDLMRDVTDPKRIEYFNAGLNAVEGKLTDNPKLLKEFLKKVLETSDKLSFEELFSNITDLQLGMDVTFQKNRPKGSEGRAIKDEQLIDLVGVWFAQEALNNLPQFKDITKEEKELIFWGVSIRNGLSRHLEQLRKEKSSSDSDEEDSFLEAKFSDFEIESRLKFIKSIPKDRLFNNEKFRSVDNIILAYKYLADHKKAEEIFMVRSGNYDVENKIEAERFFLDFILTILPSKSLGEIIDFFDDLESKGVYLFPLFEKNPDMTGMLVQQLTNTMQDKSIELIPLEKLIKVSKWISNPFLRNSFQRYVKNISWESLSFEKKLQLLYGAENGIDDFKTREDFVENDVTNKEQYDKVIEKIKLSIDDLTSEGNKEAGVMAILSQFNFRFRDVNAFTKAILTSQTKESELRKIVYGAVEEFFDHNNINSMKSALLSADRILRGLYSLDEFGRQALLRHVMTSEYGLLPNKNKKEKFLNYLFSEWIEKREDYKDLNTVLQRVKEALVGLPEWELLYFALNNALVDKVAIPPNNEHKISWGDMYEVTSDMEGLASQKDIDKIILDANLDKMPKSVQKNPRDNHQFVSAFAEQKLYELLEKSGTVKFDKQGRLNPLQFTKQTVSRIGAPGVRFLQLAPQFIDIPAQYEEEFSEVYDGLKGQSKLAAISLLQREWGQVWENISEIGERVGGGSIVTVYKVRTKENETEVIKVRNPNIKYHLIETYRFASDILNLLSSKYGGGYVSARIALDDIKKWIEGDISFEGFLAQDKIFREQQQGYKPTGFKYSIKVPISKGPENPYFSREEYIEGINLTKWQELRNADHDMKQITSLMLKSYLEQIKNGLVHSDVHPGNFRVNNNEVVILDRNFYLNLSEQEKNLIFSIFNPFVSNKNRADQMLNYLKTNQFVDEIKVRPIIEIIITNVVSQDWAKVHSGIIKIKQFGINIPLNFTLLLKNLNSLELMAKKAGFKNITEAFFFSGK